MSFSPVARGVAWRCSARSVVISLRAKPHFASCARLFPALRVAKMRTALLRRAAMIAYARAAQESGNTFALCVDSPSAVPTPISGPSPAVSWHAAVRGVVILPRAIPHRALRARLAPAFAACHDSSSSVLLCRNVQICPWCMPKSQTVVPILCRQHRVAQPSAVTPWCRFCLSPKVSCCDAVRNVVIPPPAAPHSALCARLAPALRSATARPARLRHAASPTRWALRSTKCVLSV